MAISFGFDAGSDNEYMANAEQMMESQRRKERAVAGGGGGNPIAVVLDLLGIERQVAKPPRGESSKTGDLASTPAESVETVDVTDKKGDVVDTVQQVLNPDSGISRLPLAPLELEPFSPLSGQGIPRPLTRIDPNTGLVQ